MTPDTSFLTKEQLRYIRRSGNCRIFPPGDIFPMIDLVIRHYDHARRPGTFSSPYSKYEHDIKYILWNFPVYEVHSYMAALDSKFMKNLYAGLESIETSYGNYEDMDCHNRKVYDRYQLLKPFIPLIKSQMIICG